MLLINLVSYTIFSIIIMVFVHFVYNFLKDNYTTKKVRFLGKFQNEKYQEILNELNVKEEPHNSEFISSLEKKEMQKSLLDYMQLSII